MSMEELLEKVARELDVAPLNRREVLKRRLLPLLEAGQALRHHWREDEPQPVYLIAHWDAARDKAMEP